MTNLTNNPNTKIYAILADSVYWDVRKEITDNITGSNWTPIPSDWKLIKEMSGSGKEGKKNNPNLDGFTARAYKNSNFS